MRNCQRLERTAVFVATYGYFSNSLLDRMALDFKLAMIAA
jgi:hypothetical protein